MQFVITTTEPIENLYQVAQQVLERAKASGMFWFVDSDLKLDKPQADASWSIATWSRELGLTKQDVGSVAGRRHGRRLRQLLLPSPAARTRSFRRCCRSTG